MGGIKTRFSIIRRKMVSQGVWPTFQGLQEVTERP